MPASVHLRASVVLLAVFLASGLWIEAALGLRLPALADDPLRREFVRLGHAHGGILSMANLVMAWVMVRLETPEGWARVVRPAFFVGAACVGLGFGLGGIFHGTTDPGPFVLLVPAGAMLWICGLAAVALVRPGDRPPAHARNASQQG
ncbi:MAG: hypothetical protein D6705_06390 [Deltaproteobacteria bacterium]|nr:MAG: hypothetical protein D6705_06390 [Deltaproteobacteria bacterium]